METKIQIHFLMNMLKYKEKYELAIAIVNNKLTQHNKTWQYIKS